MNPRWTALEKWIETEIHASIASCRDLRRTDIVKSQWHDVRAAVLEEVQREMEAICAAAVAMAEGKAK